MDDLQNLNPPAQFALLQQATVAAGFVMASEPLTGALLRTLAAAKPGGRLLELGTGTGLATAWLLQGMDEATHLDTVDNDATMQTIARQSLGDDRRVTFHTGDGGEFILAQFATQVAFDLIFADTWPGKYTHLAETLALLKPGGLYVIDDMLPQPNWPADHAPKVARLIATLEQRADLQITKLSWASGLMIGTKVKNTTNRKGT